MCISEETLNHFLEQATVDHIYAYNEMETAQEGDPITLLQIFLQNGAFLSISAAGHTLDTDLIGPPPPDATPEPEEDDHDPLETASLFGYEGEHWD